MKHLTQLAEHANQWGRHAVTFPLTQQGVNTLGEILNSEASPEFVHMDGEASKSQVRATYQRLYQTKAQLERYCAKNGLTMPEIHEL